MVGGAIVPGGYLERARAPERHISQTTASAEGRIATPTPINADCIAVVLRSYFARMPGGVCSILNTSFAASAEWIGKLQHITARIHPLK